MKKLVLIFALLLSSPVHAQTIDSLGAGAAVSGTDLLPSYQGANPAKRVTVDQIKTYTGKSAVRATTTTTEALADSDQNKLVTFSNGSAVACTIAQAGAGGNFVAGWAVSLKNLGVGTVTCTPTTSTVDGAANFTLTTGQGVDLYSDGTNYFTQPGKAGGTPGGSSGQIQFNNAGAFGGFLSQPSYISGNWYLPANFSTLQVNAVGMQQNTIACTFGYVTNKVTVNSLGAGLSTVGSTNVQFAIYADASGRPGALIGRTNNIANTAGTNISGALAANKEVGPGGADGSANLWFCANQNDSTGTYAGGAQTSARIASAIGSATLSDVVVGLANDFMNGIYCQGANCNGGSSTFNTWPATLAGSTWSFCKPSTTGLFIPAVAFKAN